jgi:hypothetical protein
LYAAKRLGKRARFEAETAARGLKLHRPSMKPLYLIALLLIAGSAAACGGEACESEAAGFSLVVAAPGMDDIVHTIDVLLVIGDDRWTHSFDLAGTLADGETSLFVAVDPAPEAAFKAALLVEGYSDRGKMTARGSAQFQATPDACNRFRVTLARQK